MYKIMNKELTGYSLNGWECLKPYEDQKDAHLNKNDARYGDVLVKYKRVRAGFEIKFRFYFSSHWYWKPVASRYGGYFHWLFFMIWVSSVYSDVFDKIEKDHLTEFLNSNS